MDAYLTLIIALLLGGVFCGLVAGLLGVGGGAVIVPVLYEAFLRVGVEESVIYHLAIGTSLAIIIPTSLRSFWSHWRRDAVDLVMLRRWLWPIVIGVVLGSLVARYTSGYSLRVVFTVILFVLGIQIIFFQRLRFGNDFPPKPVPEIYASGVGFFSTLMGIGGGSFSNLFYALYNKPMHRSVATSSGVGVIISVPAVIGLTLAGWGQADLPYGSIGYVNWLAAAIMLPVSVAIAPLGVRIAHSISAKLLKRLFGVFLVLVSLRFLLTLF